MNNEPNEKNSKPFLTGISKTAVIFRSRGFNLAVKIFVGLALVLLIFQLGMAVGYRKARFSYGWGDNYHLVFGGPKEGVMRNLNGRDFMNGHGVSGRIIQIGDDDIIVKSVNGLEMAISFSQNTNILIGRNRGSFSDLRENEIITAIGRPENNGSITAEIIRVLEPPFMPDLPPVILPYNY